MPGFICTLLSKVPDLIVNILGVLIGGLIAFAIANWQYRKQTKETTKSLELQQETALNREKELLKILFDRVKVEIRDNHQIIRLLQNTICQTPKSRRDIWDWAKTFRFSFSAYNELLRSGLQRYLPSDILKELYISYQLLENLTDKVMQGSAAHDYYNNLTNGQEFADQELRNLQTYSHTIFDHFQYVMDQIKNC